METKMDFGSDGDHGNYGAGVGDNPLIFTEEFSEFMAANPGTSNPLLNM